MSAPHDAAKVVDTVAIQLWPARLLAAVAAEFELHGVLTRERFETLTRQTLEASRRDLVRFRDVGVAVVEQQSAGKAN